MNSIRNFFNIIKIKAMPEPPILGRWGINYDYKYLKTDLANHDCCGDKLCGDPKRTKEYITNNLGK